MKTKELRLPILGFIFEIVGLPLLILPFCFNAFWVLLTSVGFLPLVIISVIGFIFGFVYLVKSKSVIGKVISVLDIILPIAAGTLIAVLIFSGVTEPCLFWRFDI